MDSSRQFVFTETDLFNGRLSPQRFSDLTVNMLELPKPVEKLICAVLPLPCGVGTTPFVAYQWYEIAPGTEELEYNTEVWLLQTDPRPSIVEGATSNAETGKQRDIDAPQLFVALTHTVPLPVKAAV